MTHRSPYARSIIRSNIGRSSRTIDRDHPMAFRSNKPSLARLLLPSTVDPLMLSGWEYSTQFSSVANIVRLLAQTRRFRLIVALLKDLGDVAMTDEPVTTSSFI